MVEENTELKHTPGPWYASFDIEDDEMLPSSCGQSDVVALYVPVVGFPGRISTEIVATMQEGHLESNARLVAAAPELLEACIQANQTLNEHFGVIDGDEGGNAVHDMLRAVIAKATK